MHNWPLEGTGEGSEPTTREPAWESDTQHPADSGTGMGRLSSGGPRPLPGTLASRSPEKEISDPPTPYFNSFTEDGAPLPQPCSCLSGQREGKWPEGEV